MIQPHLDPHPDDNLTVGADGFDQKAFLGSEEEAQLLSGMYIVQCTPCSMIDTSDVMSDIVRQS